MPLRTFEESCNYLDSIVGRCVREADFAERVLADPEAALASYDLTEDEMDDFRALRDRHREEAATAWAMIRAALERH